MRRSLLSKLLLTVLAVVVCAAAVTLWLTGRDHRYDTPSSTVPTFQSDGRLFDGLLEYGRAHTSWGDVDTTVRAMALDSGRRIVLRTFDGHVLVDSAIELGVTKSTPAHVQTALLDPRAFSSQDSVQDSTNPDAISLPVAAYQLSEAELADRNLIAGQAAACLASVGITSSIVQRRDGHPDLVFTSPGITSVAQRCVDMVALRRPGEREVRLRALIAVQTVNCLRERGISSWLDSSGEWPSARVPANADRQVAAARDSCRDQAARDALAPYVAPAVQVSIGANPRPPGFVESAGAARLTLAIAGVLTIAIVATLAAGRRTVRPIRSLTRAATRMAGGERNMRVKVGGHDEVARLGAAFNAMAESVAAGELQRKNMMSDLAHDLRSPVAIIRGHLEGVQDGVVALDNTFVESMIEETALLQHLLDDLQDLALAETGQLRIHQEEVDAPELVRVVAAAHSAAAARASITIVVDAPPRLVIVADPVRLRQALANLVGNALRYTGSAGSITIRLATDTPFQSLVTFEVSDTGSGIDAHHLPHLFDRFYRVDPSRNRSSGGSGLGLAIVRHLVEAHGGVVSVSSTVGRGTTFVITMPVDGTHRSDEHDALASTTPTA